MSARSSTSSTFSIPTLFSASSAAQAGDIEAQSPSKFKYIRLPSPAPAVTRTSRHSSLEASLSTFDDCFGRASPSFIPHGTQQSQQDGSLPKHTDAPPPPYSHSRSPPAYTCHAEHPTLVKHLFMFGFLCPLLWVAGAFFLILPLRAPQESQSTKTEAQGGELVQAMRSADMKWAKRCLVAFSSFLLVVVIVVVTAVLVVKT